MSNRYFLLSHLPTARFFNNTSPITKTLRDHAEISGNNICAQKGLKCAIFFIPLQPYFNQGDFNYFDTFAFLRFQLRGIQKITCLRITQRSYTKGE